MKTHIHQLQPAACHSRTGSSRVSLLVMLLLTVLGPRLVALQLADLQPGRNFPTVSVQFGGGRSESIDTGDVDNDGDLDVIVANGGDGAAQANRIFINMGGVQGGSEGAFSDQTGTRFAGMPNDTSRDIAFVDFDGDADLDIFVANRGTFSNGGEVSRLYANSGGLQSGTIGFFQEETSSRWGTLVSVPLSQEVGVQDGVGPWRDFSCDCDFADLDDDGDTDLFHSSYGPNIDGTRDSRVFLNDGSGVFNEAWPWANPGADTQLHTLDVDLIDLDGDFDIDLVASSRNSQARIYRNNLGEPPGSDMFTDITQSALINAGATATGTSNYETECGDMDGDGDFDIWMTNYTNFSERALRNNGNLTFTAMTGWISGDPNSEERESDFIDYDGDGDLDTFMANFLGTNSLYQSGLVQGLTSLYHRTGTSAGGSLAPWPELPTSGNSGQTLDAHAADIDGDGDEDLLLANDANQSNRLYVNALGVPDVHAPTFAIEESQADKPNGSATPLHVQIRDNSSHYLTAYYDTNLIYSVDSGPEVSLPMFAQGSMQFRGVIPAQVDANVSYYFECTDLAGNTASSASHSFQQGNGPVVFAGFSHAPLGNATLTLDPEVQLYVGNLGSSGNDGIAMSFGGSFSGTTLELDELKLGFADTGVGFEACALVTVAGTPTVGSTFSAEAIGGVVLLNADFTGLGATSATVQYWNEGVMIDSLPLPLGGLPILPPIPLSCSPPENEEYVCFKYFSWTGNPPGWRFSNCKWQCIDTLLDETFDTMFIVPDSPTSIDSIDSVELFGTNLASGITITGQSAQFGQTMASGLGGVSILPDGDNLRAAIPNLGSSGNDGIAFGVTNATGDPSGSVGELSVSYLQPDLNNPDGLGFDVSFYGIGDEDAGNVRVDLDSVPNPNYQFSTDINGYPVLICVTPPNPAIPNPTPFTVELYNGGILVATMLNQTAGSSFSVTHTQPTGQFSVMATTDPVFMKVDTFPAGSMIATSSGLNVMADEVRMIPNATTQTLIGITGVEVTNITLPEMVFTGTSITAKPWTKLTGSLAGAQGAPTLIGAGPLTGDSDNALVLIDGAVSSPVVIVVGFTNISAAFKSGILVPSPDFLFSLSTNGMGGLTLPFAWPAGLPSGIPFYNQAWITDPTAPSGFSATNGLQGTTP